MGKSRRPDAGGYRLLKRYVTLKRSKKYATRFLLRPYYGIGTTAAGIDWEFFMEVLSRFSRNAESIETAVKRGRAAAKAPSSQVAPKPARANAAEEEDEVILFNPQAFQQSLAQTSFTEVPTGEQQEHALVPLQGDDDDDAYDDEEEDEEEDLDDEADGTPAAGRLYDVKNYVEALLWCHMMYSQGYCPDYAFTYRFRYAPNIRVLAQTPEAELGSLLVPYNPASLPLPPLVFAMALLPYEAKHLLPASLQKLMEKGSPIGDLFHGKASKQGTIDTARLFGAVQEVRALAVEHPNLLLT